ncbi:MAG: hypothetical protein LBF82_00235 [Lactobacillales bacterium]|nr:hypothetical protein [Lactobacillales bacterium]
MGGYFDKEFSEATSALFERLKNKEVVFVVSDLLRKELIGAPEHVQTLLDKYEAICFEPVILTRSQRTCQCLHYRESRRKNKFGGLPTHSDGYAMQSGCVGKLEL